MSIKVTYPNHLTYERLYFGIPLEDVFPPGEVHPSLKNFFELAYEKVARKGYPLSEVLSYCQGSLHERLALKQRLTLSRNMTNIKASPGAFLWVIRHFIGLLPVQLMPRFIGNRKYCWCKLTKDCKNCLADYVTRGRNDHVLLQKLAEELLRLPTENFLLFATLLNLLRKLAVLPGGEPRINKSGTLASVKYFSSSIFVRPFRPGIITKVDRQYHPLMLYIVLKWPKIRKICIEASNYSFDLSLEEMYPERLLNSPPSEHLYYVSTPYKDRTTQTLPSKLVLEQTGTLVRCIPHSYYDFEYLRDTACQTESDLLEENVELIFRHDINRKNCCCCFLGSHYEKSSKTRFLSELSKRRSATANAGNTQNYYSDDGTQTTSLNNNNYKTDSGNLCDSDESKQAMLLQYSNARDSPTSDFSENIHYDDCSISKLVWCPTCGENSENISKPIGNNTERFSPVNKSKKRIYNEALKEKLSKIGWLFETPNNSLSCEKHTEDKATRDYDKASILPIGWNIFKRSRYRHDYELQKSLNEELKEKFSKMKLQNRCTKSISSPNAGKELKTIKNNALNHPQVKLTENVKPIKSNSINMNKIKSRFNFLQVFKPKKMKSKRSYSYEQIASDVKYKKMGSVSSTL